MFMLVQSFFFFCWSTHSWGLINFSTFIMICRFSANQAKATNLSLFGITGASRYLVFDYDSFLINNNHNQLI
ncbi:hypothetical protein GLYMA_17G046950v4 [Glycine max]|nr:hypothetical protein GLYMA_17G046950v4 [Glycine max]KAH1116798.1 hypothetical protein GYH30_046259 [Glycine max]